jgi:hypothetical protein
VWPTSPVSQNPFDDPGHKTLATHAVGRWPLLKESGKDVASSIFLRNVKNQHGQKEIKVIYFILITAHPTGQNKKNRSTDQQV